MRKWMIEFGLIAVNLSNLIVRIHNWTAYEKKHTHQQAHTNTIFESIWIERMLTFWREEKNQRRRGTNRENTHRSNRVGAFLLFIADRVPVLAYRISIWFQFQFKFVAKLAYAVVNSFSITTSFWPSFSFFLLPFFANGIVNCCVLQLCVCAHGLLLFIFNICSFFTTIKWMF